MNEITPFQEAQQLAPPPSNEGRDELGQDDFLTLMITQFRNQDPFEPMDNGDFLGQLAQFGTVNGIEELNSSFAGLSGSIQNDQALRAANLVGHSVLANTDIGHLAEGQPLAGAIELETSVSNVEIEISDINGQLVQRLQLGNQASGLAQFEWDGRDLKGNKADPGQYIVSSRVLRGTQIESAETLIQSSIESVSLGRFGEGLTLNLEGGRTLDLNQVRRIL